MHPLVNVAFVVSVVALVPAASIPEKGTPGYVVCFREDLAASSFLRAAALRTRVESMGAHLTRALVDDLPAPASTRLGPSNAAPPLAFSPERVWLIEAADSVTTATAALQLVRNGDAEWAEPVVMREPA